MKTLLLLCALCILCGCTVTLPLQDTFASQKAEGCVAIKPWNKESPAGVTRLWGATSDFWPQRAQLRVLFMDGSASQQRRAWYRFQKIDELINLTFVRVPTGPAEIRVSFDPGDGHWSYVGRDNLGIPQHRATMNLALGAWDGSTEWNRVALHEVLHAAGFQHEHQHPQSDIPWNVPVVLRDYAMTQGWSEAETRYQVIDRSSERNFIGSAPNSKSIMMYPIAKEHVLDKKFAVGWNRKLSPVDIETLKKIYP